MVKPAMANKEHVVGLVLQLLVCAVGEIIAFEADSARHGILQDIPGPDKTRDQMLTA